MKIQSEVLKNIEITTSFGNFKVDGDGIVDVPDEAAHELVADGVFTQIDAGETKEVKPKAIKTEPAKDSSK